MSGIYTDIHTHKRVPDRKDLIAVRSLMFGEAQKGIPEHELFSVGLHPWETDTEILDEGIFEQVKNRSEFVAIGECGIDRLRGADIKTQMDLFIQQAGWAESLKKPLIIHCVRAWQEILSIRNNLKPKAPWIVHGFRGKALTAMQLLDSGCYISFGRSMVPMNPVMVDIVKSISIDRLLLETDDGTHTVEEIFSLVAKIKNLSLVELQSRLLENFQLVTGIQHAPGMASTH